MVESFYRASNGFILIQRYTSNGIVTTSIDPEQIENQVFDEFDLPRINNENTRGYYINSNGSMVLTENITWDTKKYYTGILGSQELRLIYDCSAYKSNEVLIGTNLYILIKKDNVYNLIKKDINQITNEPTTIIDLNADQNIYWMSNTIDGNIVLFTKTPDFKNKLMVVNPSDVQNITYFDLPDGFLNITRETFESNGQCIFTITSPTQPETHYLTKFNGGDLDTTQIYQQEVNNMLDLSNLKTEIKTADLSNESKITYMISYDTKNKGIESPKTMVASVYGPGFSEVSKVLNDGKFFSHSRAYMIQEGGIYVTIETPEGAFCKNICDSDQKFVSYAKTCIEVLTQLQAQHSNDLLVIEGGSNGGLTCFLILLKLIESQRTDLLEKTRFNIQSPVTSIDSLLFIFHPISEPWLDVYGDPLDQENRENILENTSPEWVVNSIINSPNYHEIIETLKKLKNPVEINIEFTVGDIRCPIEQSYPLLILLDKIRKDTNGKLQLNVTNVAGTHEGYDFGVISPTEASIYTRINESLY